MSILNQFPRSSQAASESAVSARVSVGSGGSKVTSIHRNVSQEVDSVMAAESFSEAEMRELVAKKIQSLPPLSKTIVDIYALRRSPDPDVTRLKEIIRNDSATAGNLVKICHCVAYGLSKRVKTPEDALSQLGTRMVINVAMSTSMSAHVKADLAPYGATQDSFADTSSTQGLIIRKWKEPKFSTTADDVQFAALLQEIGALVTSQIAMEKGKASALQSALSQTEDRVAAEESIFGMSSASVAAIVFSEWKFSQDIVDYIGGSDRPETAPEYAAMGAKALKIAKVLAPL
ncbi:MAG: HDOD domain-containing protein [Patescibacteria group bacterium]